MTFYEDSHASSTKELRFFCALKAFDTLLMFLEVTDISISSFLIFVLLSVEVKVGRGLNATLLWNNFS